MSKRARWVLAFGLLLLVVLAASGLGGAFLGAPRLRLARVRTKDFAAARPAKKDDAAPMPRLVEAKPAPRREAKTSVACAKSLHFVPGRWCVPYPAEEGRALAALVYPDRPVRALWVRDIGDAAGVASAGSAGGAAGRAKASHGHGAVLGVAACKRGAWGCGR